MAGKKSQKCPRRKRMNRLTRLQHARRSNWLNTYRGKDSIKGYCKWYGVDPVCALTELCMLGLTVSEEKETEIRKRVEDLALARKRHKERMALKKQEALFKERFVSEQLIPIPAAMDITSAALGEPAIPWKFTWRGETIEIAKVIRKWKSTSPCTHGSGERYVRRHWYEIATVKGRYLRIYFERRARSHRERKKRWWVFSEIEIILCFLLSFNPSL